MKRSHKWLIFVIIFLILVSAVYTITSLRDTHIIYADLSLKDPDRRYIEELAGDGIISGYSDGTFRSGETAVLGDALEFVLKGAGFRVSASEYSDDPRSTIYDFALASSFVFRNEPSDLEAPVSKLYLSHIAARALGIHRSSSPSPFTDVDDGYVTALAERGILETAEKEFRPDDTMTRGELCKLVWTIRHTDTSEGQIKYGSYSLDVYDNIPQNSARAIFLASDDPLSNDEVSFGIDVSVFQDDIDWAAVRNAGAKFAIIRAGGRGYEDGGIYPDDCFDKNIVGALEAGLDVGVYFFSQAVAVEEAAEEAEYVLEKIAPYEIKYPVVFDWETLGRREARAYGLDTDTLTLCAKTFCDMVSAAGYKPMIYFNAATGYMRYDLSALADYDFWYADYSEIPGFYYDFQMWQYSDTGRIDGIDSNVDLNLCFKKYE